MKFGKKVTTSTENIQDEGGVVEKSNEFIRSKKDNPLLKSLQLEGNFFDVVHPDATLWGDFDGIPYKCASSVEENYITVKLLNEETDVEESLTLKGEKQFKNRTEFKGRTRGEKIGTGSFLSDLNLSREVNNLTPFTMQDFEITDGKRLKFEKGTTIDGKKFENSLEVCKYYMDEWINACLIQTQLKKVKVVMGSGDTHRHAVLVPHQYKSDRSDSRPILLSEARDYLKENYDTVIAPPLMEADEIVDAMAARAYDHAKSTNTKIMVVKAANDKDARSKRGILFDWAKSFHFNNPQCWEIKDFAEDVGALEMKKGEIKGGGSVFFAYQLLMMDSADEYSPRKYLPDDFEHFGKGYGDEAFYKDFAPLKTSKEVFQKVVDKYFEWFPYGLQYTAWDGTEIDEDTLSYLQKHYQLAYMLEGKDDKSTVMDLLDRFEVDYTPLIKNNLQGKPVRTFVGCESHIVELKALIKDILENNVKGLKSKKKTDQVPMIDEIKEKLESIDFECHYDMVQEDKDVPEVTKPNKERISLIDHISKWRVENGCSPEVDLDCVEDMEIFEECLDRKEVHQGTPDVHRWYNLVDFTYEIVIEGEERYFCVSEYCTTGDMSARDMDLYTTLKDVHEVFPKQVMTTIYE